MRFAPKFIAASAILAGAAASFAHVVLQPGPAVAGSTYDAAFKVGHACKDARSTTGLTVRLPRGFVLQDVPARTGWKVDIDRSGTGTVRWTADTPAQALPGDRKGEFLLRGTLPAAPGPLYFAVLQSCDVGSADWAQLPTGAAGEKLPFPAARLNVVAPGSALVDASGAWVRAAVPGQSGTGGFMTLAAGAPLKLVGVATPVAGVAEVHEMKMEGDTMKMRAVPALELPARQAVELRPGGYHLMLMDLKQPITTGKVIPLTLTFEDAAGAKSTLAVQAPVQAAPAGAAAGEGHKH
ncbi:MAG TPA: copper chaperone PCu(A)C [Burkholderiaceae bacterium]|nr:copper chaperone PCu(A)C [Burkholderiaceae bacterium]